MTNFSIRFVPLYKIKASNFSEKKRKKLNLQNKNNKIYNVIEKQQKFPHYLHFPKENNLIET